MPVHGKNSIRSEFDYRGPKTSRIPTREAGQSAALQEVVEVEHQFLVRSAQECGAAWIVEGTLDISVCPPVLQGGEYLDIQTLVKDRRLEQGLLGLAFHPQYATNGYFYVYYTDNDGDSVVARYSVSRDNPDDADEGPRIRYHSTSAEFDKIRISRETSPSR